MKITRHATAIAAMLPVSAYAQDTGWYMQLGAAHVGFSESADIEAGGAPVPGSNASLDNNLSLAVGVGYRFSSQFSVIGLTGFPPTTTVSGTGSLSGVTVGDVQYGPAVLALNYHIPTKGAFQPFVGAGVSYTKVFSTDDSAVTNFDVDDTWGAVLRVGFDYIIDDRNGVFFSANKIFAQTQARGSLGGAPVVADITLDPLILHAGWTHRF